MHKKETNMPEKLSAGDMLPTKFEPHRSDRFICIFTGLEIASYVVKAICLPKVSKDLKSGAMLSMTLYDPVAPSVAQSLYKAVFEEIEFDLDFKLVDPDGTITSHTLFPGTKVISYQQSQFCYGNDSLSCFHVQCQVTDMILKY
jgi:hypothetical protein